MQQHHHQQRQLAAVGFGPFGSSGMGDDGMNNNLLSSSHHHQQHNVTLHSPHQAIPHHAYYQHQLGMQPHPGYAGSTIHHHPGEHAGIGGLGGAGGSANMAA